MASSLGADTQTWPHRPLRVLLAAGLLLCALAAAFGHNFAEMWIRWFPAWRQTSLSLYDRIVGGESYYTHGPIVPLVSLAIAWLVVRHRPITLAPSRLAGTALLLAGLLIHLTACLARVNFLSCFALIAALAGLVLLLWGSHALRNLWFPLAFLLLMVPLPEVSIAQLNFRLKMLAAEWGVALASALGILVERTGNSVFLQGDKHLVIANVCNGLRTLVSLIGFGALYAYVCRLRGLWRIGLFLMTVPVAVISNSIRIVMLIAVADIWTAEAATGWFHDTSGLMIYGVAFLWMFGLERLVLWLRRQPGGPVAGGGGEAACAGQWRRLAAAAAETRGWVACGLLSAAALGAWWLNGSVPAVWSQQTVRGALPSVLKVDGRLRLGYDEDLDERTLTVLETRDHLFRRYICSGDSEVALMVIFSRDNRKGTHPPDVCLEGGGGSIIAKADVSVDGVAGRQAVPCRELITDARNEKQYYLYTYKYGQSYTQSFWRQQLGVFLNGLLHRSSAGALVRVSTPVGRDLAAARRRCTALMREAVPYLDRALR